MATNLGEMGANYASKVDSNQVEQYLQCSLHRRLFRREAWLDVRNGYIYISRKRILKPDATPSILPKSTGTESPDFASTPKRPRGGLLEERERERARVRTNTANSVSDKVFLM